MDQTFSERSLQLFLSSSGLVRPSPSYLSSLFPRILGLFMLFSSSISQYLFICPSFFAIFFSSSICSESWLNISARFFFSSLCSGSSVIGFCSSFGLRNGDPLRDGGEHMVVFGVCGCSALVIMGGVWSEDMGGYMVRIFLEIFLCKRFWRVGFDGSGGGLWNSMG